MNKHVYNLDHITSAITNVGLKSGDTAYFSTGLGMLGSAQGVQDQSELNQLFLTAIKQVIGRDGTILILLEKVLVRIRPYSIL